MVYTAAVIAVIGLLLAVFVLAPMLRSEEDVKSLDRPRPGTRNLSGPAESEVPKRPRKPVPDDAVRCPECGTICDESFVFCGECAARLR